MRLCSLRDSRHEYGVEESCCKMQESSEQRIVTRPDPYEVLLNSRPLNRELVKFAPAFQQRVAKVKLRSCGLFPGRAISLLYSGGLRARSAKLVAALEM